jgi:hypothetical protein
MILYENKSLGHIHKVNASIIHHSVEVSTYSPEEDGCLQLDKHPTVLGSHKLHILSTLLIY